MGAFLKTMIENFDWNFSKIKTFLQETFIFGRWLDKDADVDFESEWNINFTEDMLLDYSMCKHIFGEDLSAPEKMNILIKENDKLKANVGVFGEVILETLDKNGELKLNPKNNPKVKL